MIYPDNYKIIPKVPEVGLTDEEKNTIKAQIKDSVNFSGNPMSSLEALKLGKQFIKSTFSKQVNVKDLRVLISELETVPEMEKEVIGEVLSD